MYIQYLYYFSLEIYVRYSYFWWKFCIEKLFQLKHLGNIFKWWLKNSKRIVTWSKPTDIYSQLFSGTIYTRKHTPYVYIDQTIMPHLWPSIRIRSFFCFVYVTELFITAQSWCHFFSRVSSFDYYWASQSSYSLLNPSTFSKLIE